MACSASCGSERELVDLSVEAAIDKGLAEGKLQGALKSCDGTDLPKGAKVVLCSGLVGLVNTAIEEGNIEVVKRVAVENGKLKVTDGSGTVVENDLAMPYVRELDFDENNATLTWKEGDKVGSKKLPFTKAVAGEKEVVLTLPDGTTVSVPKVANVITKDDFDETIEKGANKADKFGVRIAPNKGLQRTIDGLAAKVGAGLTINADGEIVLTEDLAALKRKVDELEERINAIPKHHADVLLVDGTGDVDLSFTHRTEEM